MERCHVCWNLTAVCTCNRRTETNTERSAAMEKNQRRYDAAVRSLERGWSGYIDQGPSPWLAFMLLLGFDPEQDGVYFCRDCGLAYDHECDYGGWHNDEDKEVFIVDNVTLRRP
jgi:hypothetical protein